MDEVFEYDVGNTREKLDHFCAGTDFVFNLAGVNRLRSVLRHEDGFELGIKERQQFLKVTPVSIAVLLTADTMSLLQCT